MQRKHCVNEMCKIYKYRRLNCDHAAKTVTLHLTKDQTDTEIWGFKEVHMNPENLVGYIEIVK